jgi:hypothetical protein
MLKTNLLSLSINQHCFTLLTKFHKSLTGKSDLMCVDSLMNTKECKKSSKNVRKSGSLDIFHVCKSYKSCLTESDNMLISR